MPLGRRAPSLPDRSHDVAGTSPSMFVRGEIPVVTGRSGSPEAQSRRGFAAHAAKQIVGPVA